MSAAKVCLRPDLGTFKKSLCTSNGAQTDIKNTKYLVQVRTEPLNSMPRGTHLTTSATEMAAKELKPLD